MIHLSVDDGWSAPLEALVFSHYVNKQTFK